MNDDIIYQDNMVVMESTRQYKYPILLATILISSIVGGIFLFQRPLLYYDEIINSAKSSIDHVFDYALRPVLFSFNSYAWDIFGGSYYSLRFANFLVFVLLATLIVALGLYVSGYTVAFLSLLIYLFAGNNWTIAISAMPHILSALLALLITYATLKILSSKDETQLNYLVLEFVLVILFAIAILIHPTNLCFILPSLALIMIVRTAKIFGKQQAFNKVLLKQLPLALFILITIVIINLIFQAKLGKSYIEFWQDALTKIQDPQLSLKYTKPFLYYFEILHVWFGIYFYTAVICFIYLSIRNIINLYKKSTDLLAESKSYFYISFILIISLLILSSAQWKFDRVIVGIFPILALWYSLGLYLVYTDLRRKLLFKLLGVFFLIGLMTSLFINYNRQLENISRSSNNFYSLERLGRIINASTNKPILYLGLRSGLWRGKSQIGFADKKMTSLDPYDRQVLPSNNCELLELLKSKNVDLILLHNTLPASQRSSLMQLVESGALQLLYADGREFQLWKIHKAILNDKIYSQLLELPVGSHLDLIGIKKEPDLLSLVKQLGLKSENTTYKKALDQVEHYKTKTLIIKYSKNKNFNNLIAKIEELDPKIFIKSSPFYCNSAEYVLFRMNNVQ